MTGDAWIDQLPAELRRLWAAAHGVPDAQYGVISVLDYSPDDIPAGMAATVADLDPGRLLAAALEVARQLSEIGADLPADRRAALPDAMAAYITRDLASLAVPSAGMGAGFVA
jgi:hypothetical protein